MKYFKFIQTLLFILLAAACNVKKYYASFRNKNRRIGIKEIAATSYNNEAWKDVIQYYKQLTEKFPNDAESWYRIGNAYTQLNQTRFALGAYQKALAIDSSNNKILHNMGVVQLQESTRTFLDLKNQTQPNDPLHIRAQLVINAIANLFYKEFEIEMEN